MISRNNKLKLIEDIDTATDIIFQTARVQIEKTKTNRELNKIEEQYLPKFNKIFTRIVTEYTNHIYLLHEAEKRYGQEVRNLIKSLTTKTYLLGMDYVSRALNKPELIYMTQADITNIIIQSDEAYRMFWRLINKYLQVVKNNKTNTLRRIRTAAATTTDETLNATTTDEVRNSSDESDNILLDTLINAQLIINAILTPVLAYSTLQKFRDLSETEQQQLILSENPNIQKKDLLSENATVVFATERDARVCFTCMQYEGQEWNVNSQYIVIPRIMTHPRCRCRLLLRINGKTISK